MKRIFQIYQESYGALCDYVSSRIGTGSDCRDIVEEVFVCVMERCRYFKRLSQEEAFEKLKELCDEKIEKYRKWSYRQVPYDECYGVKAIIGVDAMVELKLDLENAIKKLCVEDRQILFLHYYKDCDTKTIAYQMGMSQQAVLQRMTRARQKLRRIMQKPD